MPEPAAGSRELPPPKSTARLTGRTTATTTTIARAASTASNQPLVPLTERRSYQDKTWPRAKRKLDSDKPDVAPDGTSAGREGRQFAVANVGNNGRIYLRPTVRPAHQRYPQPSFAFPITPPGTGGLDASSQDKPGACNEALGPGAALGPQLLESRWTPTPSASPLAGQEHYFPHVQHPSRPTRPRRAMSDSTIHDLGAADDQDKDAFRVVISKPGNKKRPRTMEDAHDAATPPLLDISMPSWRIGTPRFTLRGTPVIRASSYVPTEELRSSSVSVPMPSAATSSIPELRATNLNSLALHPPHAGPWHQRAASVLPSPRLPLPIRSTLLSTHVGIEPDMFTDLTSKPACDDRCIVRYSSAGTVTAATPPRLVAEITSPTFLDYELISDFFLTFRAFLEPTDLLCMLVARPRWALARNDEVGMIVRVRTFVAIRHWILNYFVDDFLLEHDLRVTLCNLLNEFVDELSQDALCRKVQLKILAELKKCWRRVCAQYWDGPEFDDGLGPQVPIAPGGVAGNRDPSPDPGYWQREGLEPPRLDALVPFPKSPTESTSLYGDGTRAAPIGDFIVLGNRPGNPENQHAGLGNGNDSPLSLASMDIVSCSFPGKSTKAPNPHAPRSVTAHPVSMSANNGPGQVASAPRALAGKRARPTQTHKRNNSISDSLREHGSDRSLSHDHDYPTAWPSAGSLVRGNLLPPAQAFVDYEPDRLGGGSNRQTTIFQPKSRSLAKDGAVESAMFAYGMKKLLGSVRRALRNRGQGGFSPSHGAFMGISPVGPPGTTTNRLPGTAVIPQGPPRQNGGRPPVRIDLLGAEVAEDFKKAIREEEAAAKAERLGSMVPPNSAPPFGGPLEYSAAHMESSTFDSLPQNQKQRPLSDTGMTCGSKSIVIVDDTVAFGMAPAQGQCLLAGGSAADTFADALMPSCADPTPPNTPPANWTRGGSPRRPSHLLDYRDAVGRAPLGDDALPPFIPDLTTLRGTQGSHISEDVPRPSLSMARHRMRQPPVSGGTLRMRGEDRSSETHQSLDSIMHRRNASFGSSSVMPPPTMRSLDATFDSGTSVMDSSKFGLPVPVPAPLRVLRRRPGGDLRAARNVGDLDRESLRRSQSLGSLATYTESIPSSYLLSTRPNSAGRPDPVADGESEERRLEVFSVGQLAETSANRGHSAKPVMRPSFKKEAQKLAQIPDDDDGGGVESALLKLEGKYDRELFSKLPVETQESTSVGEDSGLDAKQWGIEHRDLEAQRREKRRNRNQHVLDEPAATGDGGGGEPRIGGRPDTGVRSFLSEDSLESYCSIPLLDRGLTDGPRSRTATWEWTNRSVLRGSDDEDSQDSPVGTEKDADGAERGQAQHMSFDFVQKTDSIERIKPGDWAPPEVEDHSFLHDGTDDTDLSSELSTSGIASGDGDGVFFSKYRSPDHPRGAAAPPTTTKRTSTRQMTLIQALAMSSDGCKPPHDGKAPVGTRKPPLPTPEMTPVVAESQGPTSPCDLAGLSDGVAGAPGPHAGPLRRYSVHLPFILAFDSDILAQQLTLIEKDALNEIDWRELIEMNWKNAARSDSRSWVDFLRNSDAQGVEVVIARFNIMVKWAVSEIVLIQHIEERARCIIKLIHIASHCRRYRNFATLAQLTIALSSNEVARLSKTWELVPAHDVKTLHSLESLVMPTRNFHAIRAEMEMGSNAGCIPFVGIYTHDLLYNAQRPSEIVSSPTTPLIVNFERCRIAAAVVKTLLRLLEASARYTFLPIEGITERCLWIGALADDEIRRRSEGLE